MASTPERLVLASASPTRASLLRAAGVSFSAEPAAIDESAIKRDCRAAQKDAIDCALVLAEAKARAVAGRYPGALVIGADQILVVDDEWFDKPTDLAAAAAQLRLLRGRTHVLATAACVVGRGARLWQATSQPKLTMRCFGEAFLAEYIGAEGEALLGSVGGYRIEGRGVQLFAAVEGDHFAILGLPLIELLAWLRGRGLVGE